MNEQLVIKLSAIVVVAVALLMGSVLLLAMPAAMMTAREVAWYALGRTPSDPETAA